MTSDDGTTGQRPTLRRLARFLRDQDGAVTVDFVALTAFILVLGMAATFFIATSVPHVADSVGGHMENTTVIPD